MQQQDYQGLHDTCTTWPISVNRYTAVHKGRYNRQACKHTFAFLQQGKNEGCASLKGKGPIEQSNGNTGTERITTE